MESVIADINTVLNGKHVDLKASIAKYFRALALYYFDELLDSFPLLTAFIRLTDRQKECGSQVLFNHIYSSTDSAAKLIDLLQNISVAVGVIKQVYTYVHSYHKIIIYYIQIFIHPSIRIIL